MERSYEEHKAALTSDNSLDPATYLFGNAKTESKLNSTNDSDPC